MGQDDQPRNLKAMLSEAKDTSELMVDLAYAALFFGDAGMADEVHELEELLSDLAHAMREVCVLAARSPRDAEEMSSVLHVLSAIERMGNAAVDIARIVTHRLGIPAALVADLAAAEEVSHRVRVRPDAAARAPFARRRAACPTEVGMRVVAIRRGKEWMIDPDGDDSAAARRRAHPPRRARGHPRAARARGRARVAPAGHRRRSRHPHRPRPRRRRARRDEERVRGRDRPRVLGAAVQRPGSRRRGRATSRTGSTRCASGSRCGCCAARRSRSNRRRCAGLLHLGAAAEELGDAAQQMVWLVEENEEMHPVLAIAFGDTDEVIVRVPVSPGSFLDGRTLAAANLELETGYYLLAIRRAGRYLYRPRGPVEMQAGDELIASGPDEGRSRLAELGGYRVLEDDATGEIALVRVES